MSLPDEQVVSIRRAVEQGRAPSVSGFISAAVARVQREDDLAQLLDDLDRELGPVDAADAHPGRRPFDECQFLLRPVPDR